MRHIRATRCTLQSISIYSCGGGGGGGGQGAQPDDANLAWALGPNHFSAAAIGGNMEHTATGPTELMCRRSERLQASTSLSLAGTFEYTTIPFRSGAL